MEWIEESELMPVLIEIIADQFDIKDIDIESVKMLIAELYDRGIVMVKCE